VRTGLVLQSLAPRQPFSRGSSVELRPAPKLRPARSSLPVERTTLSKFSEFGLSAPIQKALHAEGYEIPTPIQSQAIPHIMAGRDLCGIAQTGTGKTAAFALPILHQFAEAKRRPERRACRALVLSPTRELASQIAESFQTYGRNLGLSVTVAYGGVTIGKQERALSNGVDILVATPGRLLDLVERRSLSLREVEVFVLDEADRMLDLGFIHDLRRIVKLLPSERQTLFFSATMPAVIASLAEAFLKNPVQVAVAPIATTAERIAQSVMFVPTSQKLAALQAVLKDPSVERALVFTRTKHGADKVVRGLAAGRVSAAAIHGNKSQPQRERALAGFRSGQCRVLVATDIAARGIDVDGVSHVINFDLPNVPESYVHRIGRTARAGAEGIAISFCNDEERAYLREIEKLTRLKVPVARLPEGVAALPAEAPRPAQPHAAAGRPRDGRRDGAYKPQHTGRRAEEQGHKRQAQPGRGHSAHPAKAREGGQRTERAAQPRRGAEHPAHPHRGGQGNEGSSIGWLGRGTARGGR
jgi:ATP-dependent RNA helicase RhlE